MMSRLRLSWFATLAAVAFVATACADSGPTYPTTIDHVETQADVEAVEAAFADTPTEAYFAASEDIFMALGGGFSFLRAPEPEAVTALGGVQRGMAMLRGAAAMANAGAFDTLKGKTLARDSITGLYVTTLQTGAPTNGVRFLLYALDDDGYVAEPYVTVGYLDITITTTANTVTGRLEVYATGVAAVKVLDYTVVTNSSGALGVTGWAGLGVHRVEFGIALGFVPNGDQVVTWTVNHPARNLRHTVRVTSAEDGSFTFSAILRAGLRKIEISGPVDEDGNAVLTVKVGNRVFGSISVTDDGETVTYYDRDGNVLTGDQLATMQAIFWLCQSGVDVPWLLLFPLLIVMLA